MYYQPRANPGYTLPEVRAQHFGPLAVLRGTDSSGWQIDHVPSGMRIVPSWSGFPAKTLPYNLTRRMASQMKTWPEFQRRNYHLLFEDNKPRVQGLARSVRRRIADLYEELKNQ